MLTLCLIAGLLIVAIVALIWRQRILLKEKTESFLCTKLSIINCFENLYGSENEVFKVFLTPNIKSFLLNKRLFNIVTGSQVKNFLNSIIQKIESNDSKSIGELKKEIIKDICNYLIDNNSSVMTLVTALAYAPSLEEKIVSIWKNKIQYVSYWEITNMVVFCRQIPNVKYFWEMLKTRKDFFAKHFELSFIVMSSFTQEVREKAWELIKDQFLEKMNNRLTNNIIIDAKDMKIRIEAWNLKKDKIAISDLGFIINYTKDKDIKAEAKELSIQKIENL